MNSLIGISVRGKTYFFFNKLPQNNLDQLKILANNYRTTNFYDKKSDDTIIKQFITDAYNLLNITLHPVDIAEILILK